VLWGARCEKTARRVLTGGRGGDSPSLPDPIQTDPMRPKARLIEHEVWGLQDSVVRAFKTESLDKYRALVVQKAELKTLVPPACLGQILIDLD
jgi:hypothetical protein